MPPPLPVKLKTGVEVQRDPAKRISDDSRNEN